MKSKSKSTTSEDISIKTRDFEFYVKSNGYIGAVLPYYAPDHTRLIDEWYDEGKEIGEFLYNKLQQVFWPICNEPRLVEDPKLFDDLEHFLKNQIYFTDPAYYEVITSWVIATWLKESLRIAPRLIIYGTTQSGKSRAIQTLSMVAYRGYVMSIPTPAILYTMNEYFGPTLFIDEYQSITNHEKLGDIEAVFKTGYEKEGTIPRINVNTMQPTIHHVYGFMGLGTKGKLPPEDLVNRSIILGMQQKPKGSSIARRIDEKQAGELRGRLLSLRLKVLTGSLSLTEQLTQALNLALNPIPHNGSTIELGDRPIDIAESLLAPLLLFRDQTNILKVIARCQVESRDELVNTMEGRTFYALQERYKGCPLLKDSNLSGQQLRDIRNLSTYDVADCLNQDIMEQEGRDTYSKKDRIETHTVTSWLKTLGFTFHRGAGNKSFFDEKNFVPIYRTNLEKYGVRQGCPDLRTHQSKIVG